MKSPLRLSEFSSLVRRLLPPQCRRQPKIALVQQELGKDLGSATILTCRLGTNRGHSMTDPFVRSNKDPSTHAWYLQRVTRREVRP